MNINSEHRAFVNIDTRENLQKNKKGVAAFEADKNGKCPKLFGKILYGKVSIGEGEQQKVYYVNKRSLKKFVKENSTLTPLSTKNDGENQTKPLSATEIVSTLNTRSNTKTQVEKTIKTISEALKKPELLNDTINDTSVVRSLVKELGDSNGKSVNKLLVTNRLLTTTADLISFLLENKDHFNKEKFEGIFGTLDKDLFALRQKDPRDKDLGETFDNEKIFANFLAYVTKDSINPVTINELLDEINTESTWDKLSLSHLTDGFRKLEGRIDVERVKFLFPNFYKPTLHII